MLRFYDSWSVTSRTPRGHSVPSPSSRRPSADTCWTPSVCAHSLPSSTRVAGALPPVIRQSRSRVFRAVTSGGKKSITSPRGGGGRIPHIYHFRITPINGKLPPDDRLTFPQTHPHSPHSRNGVKEKQTQPVMRSLPERRGWPWDAWEVQRTWSCRCAEKPCSLPCSWPAPWCPLHHAHSPSLPSVPSPFAHQHPVLAPSVASPPGPSFSPPTTGSRDGGNSDIPSNAALQLVDSHAFP